jgi:hypothetical protein
MAVSNFMSRVGQGAAAALLAAFRQPARGGVLLQYNRPQDFQADLVRADGLAK